ncbi:MAG: hypothetical protein IJW44_00960 [Clostridia bacterium]|nr:hypothetical protein [Clostridia bacterium]
MKTRFWDLSLVLLCAALLLGFGAAILLLPHSDFSEAENRALTTWKAPTVKQIADGSFTQRLSDLYADQFPLRARFTALKATVERCLGKQENNGVLFGKEGYLIPRSEQADQSVLENNLSACQELHALSAEQGVPLSVLTVPRSVDVTTAYYPTGFATDPPILRRLTDDPSIVFPLSQLQSAASRGEAVWYKTDHHWTTAGAYLAYCSFAQELEIQPYPPEYFTPVTVTDAFLGTSYSKVGGLPTEADSIVLYRYPNDTRFIVQNGETGESTAGFYQLSALEQKDKYEVFLGGNYSRLTVTDPAEQKPRLLLVKDSFANALVPFLALHFDIDVIDPRYDKASLSLHEYDRILIVQGIDTLATDPSLGRWVSKQKQNLSS